MSSEGGFYEAPGRDLAEIWVGFASGLHSSFIDAKNMAVHGGSASGCHLEFIFSIQLAAKRENREAGRALSVKTVRNLNIV